MVLKSPWRNDFSYFSQQDNAPCHYLDSAATCLVPDCVVKANNNYLRYAHANSHRGFYPLSAELTDNVESTRQQVADFIGAVSAENIIFTQNTTSALHQIALGYVEPRITANHNLIVSVAEHHANFIPWQQITQKCGAELRILPIDENGLADLAALDALLDENTLMVAINHVSNVLGTVNPIKTIVSKAKRVGAKVLVDGAQCAGQHRINVQALACDFYVFSGHKLYAGNGCGVLYANQACIDEMLPVVLGGGIASTVTAEQSQWLTGSRKFEAGTMNSQSIIALSSALDYLDKVRAEGAERYLSQLSDYLYSALAKIGGVHIFGEHQPSSTIKSFTINGMHSHDVASILAEHNVAIRAGHHCAQPLHHALGLKSSLRVSLGIYNQMSDIDALIDGIRAGQQLFGGLLKNE